MALFNMELILAQEESEEVLERASQWVIFWTMFMMIPMQDITNNGENGYKLNPFELSREIGETE